MVHGIGKIQNRDFLMSELRLLSSVLHQLSRSKSTEPNIGSYRFSVLSESSIIAAICSGSLPVAIRIESMLHREAEHLKGGKSNHNNVELVLTGRPMLL